MGWNQGYTIFESTVVGVYDLGKLDKDMLAVLMEPYRNTDIDSGGRVGLEAKDGKNVEEIVVAVMGGKVPARPPGGDDYDVEADEQYMDAMYDAFSSVTRKFGWG